jgi:predicted DNA-binding transcriptional regulator YafY
MKLYNTLNNLILEVATADQITDAISNKKVCVIYYNGDEPGGKGLRVIEPVAYGYSKKGNPVLRAWDREGASHRAYLGKKPLPSWRFFRVDKMEFIRPTQEIFDTPRPGYNPTGDRSMERMIINAVFGNENIT